MATTFVDINIDSAAEAAAEAEARGARPTKLETLKSPDFAKTKKNPLGRPTRLLPPVSGMTLPWITAKKHEFRDPYTKNAPMLTSWACPRVHGGKRCLTCELAEAVEAKDNALFYMLRVKDRHMALDLRVEDGEPVLRKFEFGATVQKQMLSLINDRKLDFSSFSRGFPLDIMYDKTQPGPSMWKADRPDQATPQPISAEMIEMIQEAYPAGGMASLLFVPDAAWQYKQFKSGKLVGLDLPWNLVDNLPDVDGEDEAVAVESRVATGVSSNRAARVNRNDIAVGPDDDVAF